MRATKKENWEIYTGVHLLFVQKLPVVTYRIQNSANGIYKVVHHDKLNNFFLVILLIIWSLFGIFIIICEFLKKSPGRAHEDFLYKITLCMYNLFIKAERMIRNGSEI